MDKREMPSHHLSYLRCLQLLVECCRPAILAYTGSTDFDCNELSGVAAADLPDVRGAGACASTTPPDDDDFHFTSMAVSIRIEDMRRFA